MARLRTVLKYVKDPANLWLPVTSFINGVRIQVSPPLPRVGAKWIFYGDEAGEPKLGTTSRWFCYAMLGVPTYTNDEGGRSLASLAKRFGPSLSIDQLSACAQKLEWLAHVAYLNLADADVVQHLGPRWDARRAESRRTRGDAPTVANMVWIHAVSFSTIGIACQIGLDRPIGAIEICYHQKSLKAQEEQLVVSTFKGILSEKMREVFRDTRLEGFKKGVDVFGEAWPQVCSVAALRNKSPYVPAIDSIVGTVYRQLRSGDQPSLPGWVQAEDTTYAMTNWLRRRIDAKC